MINHDNRQRGLTILELMVVLAIVAILTVVAIPSFNKMNGHLRMTTAAQALVTDLRAAQSNAIRQGTTSELDLTRAVTSAGDGGTQQSYQDFCDDNSCAAVDGASTARTTISFNASGYVASPASLPFTVTLQSAQTGESVKVRVRRTGRICTYPGAAAPAC
jgi:type IV fimbrial biogenesis protein FimT